MLIRVYKNVINGLVMFRRMIIVIIMVVIIIFIIYFVEFMKVCFV